MTATGASKGVGAEGAAKQVRLWHASGWRRQVATRRWEFCYPIVRAVEIRRKLAAAVPKRFARDLAKSLSNYSNLLNDLGRHEEAAEAAREAAEIRARLP